MVLNAMTGVLIIEKERHKRALRSHMETEAEARGTWPHVQGCLQPPEAGRGGKEPPLEPVQRAWPCSTRTSDIWSADLEEMILVG